MQIVGCLKYFCLRFLSFMLRKSSGSILFLFIAFICSGQGKDTLMAWQGFGIEVNELGAKVLKHEAKFTLPIPAISSVTDINFIQHTYGRKTWQQRRNYPTLGVGMTYTVYGVDSVYGRSFSIYPNIELRLARARNLEWTLRLGEGIAYITRSYSRVAPVDTINFAISSHVNGYSILMSDLRYHINDHWDIQAGLNLTHISNSSLRKPNLGVNLYGGHVGIRYFPVTSRPKFIPRELKPLTNRWLAQVRTTMSMVSAYAPKGPLYPVYIVSAYGSRRWNGTNKLLAGIDYSYHGDVYALLRNNSLETGHEILSSSKSGLFVGNEFMLGHVGITAQLGVYIMQAYIKKDPVYEKVGCNYYILQRERGPIKEAFVSFFLKMHLNVAEMAEVGMGLGF